MKKKTKVIIIFITIIIIGIIGLFYIQNYNNKSNIKENIAANKNNTKYFQIKNNNKHDDLKTQEENDAFRNEHIKKNNKKNNIHVHTWKVNGHYEKEGGYKMADDQNTLYIEGDCHYECKLCDKYLFDVNSIDDLKNHLENNCSAMNDSEVYGMDDTHIISYFDIVKHVQYDVFVKDGYVCETCGKVLSADEAKQLGIWKAGDEINR